MTTDKPDLLALAQRAKELDERLKAAALILAFECEDDLVARSGKYPGDYITEAADALSLLAEGVMELTRERDEERQSNGLWLEIAGMVQQALGDEELPSGSKRTPMPASAIPPMNFDIAIRKIKARAEAAEARLAEVERERDEAVQKGAELLAASLRQTAAAVGESEARRKTLLEKSDELRREWQRAENAEAERDALREQLSREQEKIKRWIVTDHEKRSAAARKRAEEAALTPSPEETKT